MWRPPSIADVDIQGLSYIVVDEIVGGTVGLAVSGWPRLDRIGRLRFVPGELIIGADKGSFERFVARNRQPRRLARRPLRIGDVFAAAVDSGVLDAATEDDLVDPAALLGTPVYDISADARDAAKMSFYGAVTPKLKPSEAQRLAKDTR